MTEKEIVKVEDERPEDARIEVAQPAASPARTKIIVAVAALLLIAVSAIALIWWIRSRSAANSPAAAEKEHAEEKEHGAGPEVMLSPEAAEAAGIEVEGTTERPATGLVRVTGTVETNAERTEQATPLVSGRVERVNVVLGDQVRAGTVLAVISSPQIAQMHGKLHEAETQRALAERNLARVMKSENRVAVLQAKARLTEAEATLKRTRRLIELGAGAGKDLIAAETAYQTAKADFDFQSNISLNREVQEAQAAVETARVDVAHIRDEMKALGAPVQENELQNHRDDSSLVRLLAPASGTVTERLVNAGAGIEAGKPLFTIANNSSVWVIANVPEGQLTAIQQGAPAEIRGTALGDGALAGTVGYIDPRLNEETRTGRVRVELPNPGGRLRAGMFVEVGFQSTTSRGEGQELVVRESALQRIGERTVVFVPKDDEPNAYEVREVQVSVIRDGYARVIEGLKLGEKVVTKGSFTLKTQLQKGEMGGHTD